MQHYRNDDGPGCCGGTLMVLFMLALVGLPLYSGPSRTQLTQRGLIEYDGKYLDVNNGCAVDCAQYEFQCNLTMLRAPLYTMPGSNKEVPGLYKELLHMVESHVNDGFVVSDYYCDPYPDNDRDNNHRCSRLWYNLPNNYTSYLAAHDNTTITVHYWYEFLLKRTTNFMEN